MKCHFLTIFDQKVPKNSHFRTKSQKLTTFTSTKNAHSLGYRSPFETDSLQACNRTRTSVHGYERTRLGVSSKLSLVYTGRTCPDSVLAPLSFLIRID